MTPITDGLSKAWTYVTSGPAGMVSAAALGLLVLVVIWQAAKRAGQRAAVAARTADPRRLDNALTFVVAGIVTAFNATGMWNVFGDKLHLTPVLRVALFSMFELTMLVCAIRARRRVLDPEIGTAGVEGVMVWVAAATSGVLSASDADTVTGAVIRLITPLFAAFLWERGMSIERRKAAKRTKRERNIHWRITPERVLVWLGVAEPSDRTATEVDAQRRMTRVALAAHRVRTLDAEGETGRCRKRAARRLTAAMRDATKHTPLATDTDHQDTLLAQIGALVHAETLAILTPPSPWTRRPLAPPVKVVMVNPLALMPRPDRDDTVSLADLSQADAIRHAMKVTGSTDPGDVVAWLADHDLTVVRQRVSDVLRRDGITNRTPLESLSSHRASA
jgi:hypothetical protein